MIAAHPLLLPLLAMVALTLVVWLRLYMVRLPEMRRSRIRPQQLAGSADKHLLKDTRASDNFINLFEVPVLFYVLALYLFVTGTVDGGYVAAAWTFVAFRALHSAVHCTFNKVMLRFYLYLFSTLAVAYIAVRAAIAHASV